MSPPQRDASSGADNATTPGAFLDAPDQPDLVLQGLAAMAQSTAEVEIGMTLTVSGVVLTGTLVGRSTWLDELEELNVDHAAVARALRANMPASPVDPHHYEFIHLRDAKYVIGARGGVVPENARGILWRGRIAHVSGWSFGRFEATETDV